MIKPKWRKRCGITALITNNLALGYSLYTQQSSIAETAIWVNAVVILAWYVSEGFLEHLISMKLNGDTKDDK